MATKAKTLTILNSDTVILPAEVYNRRITIQQPLFTSASAQLQSNTVSDDMGGSVTTNMNADTNWETILTTWAHIEPWQGILSGRERWLADQIYPLLRVRVLIRWRPDVNITAAMRILYGQRNLNIRAVYSLAESRRVIEMLAEELQNYGSLH